MKKAYIFLACIAGAQFVSSYSMYIPHPDEDTSFSLSEFIQEVREAMGICMAWIRENSARTPEFMRTTLRTANQYVRTTTQALNNGIPRPAELMQRARQTLITENVRAALEPARVEAIEFINEGNIQVRSFQVNTYLLALGLLTGGTGSLLLYKNHHKIKRFKSKETFFTALGGSMLLSSFLLAYTGIVTPRINT